MALAHLRVAFEPEDDGEVGTIPASPVAAPRLLRLPAAWWETPEMLCQPLAPVPEEARTARLFVRHLLTRWGMAGLVEDAELIVTELVVNAVRHGMATAHLTDVSQAAPPPLQLCLLRRAGEIMLAVTDPSAQAPELRSADAAREYGRGLQLVGALSHVWGWSPIEGRGKAVWAVLKP